jgi:hypothetical protein
VFKLVDIDDEEEERKNELRSHIEKELAMQTGGMITQTFGFDNSGHATQTMVQSNTIEAEGDQLDGELS